MVNENMQIMIQENVDFEKESSKYKMDMDYRCMKKLKRDEEKYVFIFFVDFL